MMMQFPNAVERSEFEADLLAAHKRTMAAIEAASLAPVSPSASLDTALGSAPASARSTSRGGAGVAARARAAAKPTQGLDSLASARSTRTTGTSQTLIRSATAATLLSPPIQAFDSQVNTDATDRQEFNTASLTPHVSLFQHGLGSLTAATHAAAKFRALNHAKLTTPAQGGRISGLGATGGESRKSSAAHAASTAATINSGGGTGGTGADASIGSVAAPPVAAASASHPSLHGLANRVLAVNRLVPHGDANIGSPGASFFGTQASTHPVTVANSFFPAAFNPHADAADGSNATASSVFRPIAPQGGTSTSGTGRNMPSFFSR
jgi:hypothetical protein